MDKVTPETSVSVIFLRNELKAPDTAPINSITPAKQLNPKAPRSAEILKEYCLFV